MAPLIDVARQDADPAKGALLEVRFSEMLP